MPLTESMSAQLDYLDVSREGELIRGLRRYFFQGEEPQFQDMLLQMIYAGCKLKLDENRKRAEEISAIRSEAGKRGGAPVGNQNAKTSKTSKSLLETTNEYGNGDACEYGHKETYSHAYAEQTDNQSSSSLSAPPLEGGADGSQNKPALNEVLAYFAQNGSTAEEALSFIGYYDCLGWRYKRTGNPITSWKKAASSWIKKGKDGTASTPEIIAPDQNSNNSNAEEARQKLLAQRNLKK